MEMEQSAFGMLQQLSTAASGVKSVEDQA
jgi:hypothetical protein